MPINDQLVKKKESGEEISTRIQPNLLEDSGEDKETAVEDGKVVARKRDEEAAANGQCREVARRC